MMNWRRIDWTFVVETIVYVLILYMLVRSGRGTPVGMRLWHNLAKVCQRGAYTLGKAGMYAEKAYWRAVERARS